MGASYGESNIHAIGVEAPIKNVGQRKQKIVKACDACRKQKIGCDGFSPCSRCLSRNARCVFTHEVKTRATPVRNARRVLELEERLRALEASITAPDFVTRVTQLASASPKASSADKKIVGFGGDIELQRRESNKEREYNSTESHTTQHDQTQRYTDQPDPAQLDSQWGFWENAAPSYTQQPHASENADLQSQVNPRMESIDEERKLLDGFFRGFNRVFPLFDPANFMTSFEQNASSPENVSSDWMRAQNTVLALALRLRSIDQLGGNDADRMSLQYLQAALQTLPRLTQSHNISVLSVQAVLAMAVLLQGTSDPVPGSMLVATAIRQIHILGLHQSSLNEDFQDSGRELRSRIFWVAYILDKDYSLQLKQPPLLNDDDIDVDLPSFQPEDGLGILTLGNSSANLFRLRVQLAIIQSRTYTILYSLRASKFSAEERFHAVHVLDCALEDWKEAIPLEFQAENLANCVPKAAWVHMVILHVSYFNCLTKVHGVGFEESRASCGADWMAQTGSVKVSRLLCLSAARASLRLLSLLPNGNYACIWLLLRFLTSATIIILENIDDDSARNSAISDLQLVQPMLDLLESLLKDHPTAEVQDMRGYVNEVAEKAKGRVYGTLF